MRGDAGETELLPVGLGVTVAIPVKGKANSPAILCVTGNMGSSGYPA